MEAQDNAVSDRFADAGYRKAESRLLPLLFLCYLFAYLDRVNIGFAKLQMSGAIELTESSYGFAAGIFFLGYFLLEVPSNMVLVRVGARRWIARIMITWGIVAACTMLVVGARSFSLVRFLLGAAEAGFIPGVLYYLTRWFPAARRGRVMALFLTGIPVSGAIGGPVSGWMLTHLQGVWGLDGWQWLFVLQGLPSAVLGVVVLRFLPDGPHEARWLSSGESEAITQRVQAEERGKQLHSFKDSFTEPRVWLLCAVYFLILLGLYAVSFWLPTLVKGLGVSDPLQIGMVTAVPYVCGAVAMYIAAKRSDEHVERRWHLAVPALVGAAGLALSVPLQSTPVAAVAALSFATAGVCASVSQFWNLPSALLGGTAAAAGIALVNSVGNAAGFASPFAVGWVKDHYGSSNPAVLAIAGAMALAAGLVFAIPAKLVNK